MGWIKRLGADPRVQRLVCALGAAYIRFVHASGRWRTVRGDIPATLWETRRGFILAFWHGRLLMMPCCWRRGAAMHMLISHHRDGQLIAGTIRHFDLGAVRGSTGKGGGAALRTMLKALKAGESVGITPDGPRGPAMRAQIGAITVARLAGAPIVPASYAASRRRILSSWDRFHLALPFARGVFVWGEPIEVARDGGPAEEEAARRLLEERLNALNAEAEAALSHAPGAAEET